MPSSQPPLLFKYAANDGILLKQGVRSIRVVMGNSLGRCQLASTNTDAWSGASAARTLTRPSFHQPGPGRRLGMFCAKGCRYGHPSWRDLIRPTRSKSPASIFSRGSIRDNRNSNTNTVFDRCPLAFIQVRKMMILRRSAASLRRVPARQGTCAISLSATVGSPLTPNVIPTSVRNNLPLSNRAWTRE